MFIDETNLAFSTSQNVTSTAVSENVIDLGADLDIGSGEPVFVVVVVEVAPTSNDGNETYVVTLQSGSTATPTDVHGSIPIPRTAKKGEAFAIPVPSHNAQYMRLNYTLGGTTPDITVSAYLTSGVSTQWKPVGDNS